MFQQRLSILIVTAATAWLAAGASGQDKADKADTLAREIVDRFMKAMKAEDVKAVLQVVDVPFFLEGQKNIADRDELRKVFADIFADKDLTTFTFQIKDIYSFEKIREKLLEKDRGLLKDVLDKNDRIVHVEVTAKERKDGFALMVRIREGKAMVVGFRD